jgi:hypothetical protein
MKPMAPRLASRVKSPRMSSRPTAVSPHIVMRSALASRSGFAASDLKRSAKGPRACLRYPAADHEGDESLAMPSYRKCHPMSTRSTVMAIIGPRASFPSSMSRLL